MAATCRLWGIPMRIIVALLVLCAGAEAAADSREVRFDAVDGVTVYGDLYRATGKGDDAPLILLFHQGGGDARGEYLPLVDRLLDAGYHALAIDQRRGGDRFGSVNRTASAFGDQDMSYCDAYPDLEAALRFASTSGFSGPRIVWGSSYSAALVIKLAAEHAEDIDAVLAFSPASGDAAGRKRTLPLLSSRCSSCAPSARWTCPACRRRCRRFGSRVTRPTSPTPACMAHRC